MDFEDQLDTEHLLLEDRICRTCGVSKSLLADYLKIVRMQVLHLHIPMSARLVHWNV